jgi:hypothetical protein
MASDPASPLSLTSGLRQPQINSTHNSTYQLYRVTECVPSTSAAMHRSLIRCYACRASIVEAFASLAGVSAVAPGERIRSHRQTARWQSRQQVRTFSHALPLRQSLESTEQNSYEPPPPASPSNDANTAAPWYLQISDPLPPTPSLPFHALQEIPPIPSDAPQILQPILEHLSLQIGLDNLTLLDLRTLQPPPALGSNLLMILGTARSVKHLNVSADRFCRWTRKEYKLRPYADGLLGRNELKLKLRRRARRMKLAASVGNTLEEGRLENDITTGWICVNLGIVDEDIIAAARGESVAVEEAEEPEYEETEENIVNRLEQLDLKARRKAQETPLEDEDEYRNPAEEEQPDDGYVGFGSRTNAPRIVVQMFTEEKRMEMDLEGLWDVRNTKRLVRDEQAHATAEETVGMLLAGEEGVEGEDVAEDDKDNPSKMKDRDGKTKIEEEIEDPEAREEEGEEKPMGGIGAS